MAWEGARLPVTQVPMIPVEELRRQLERGDGPIVLDVRRDAEWRAGHIPRAIHVEAGRLPAEELPLPKACTERGRSDGPGVVHCATATAPPWAPRYWNDGDTAT